MVELGNAAVQLVQPNQGVIMDTIIGCNAGLVIHRDQSSGTILKGVPIRQCQKYADYQVTFNANVAIPEGGTLGEITIGIVVDGDPYPTSLAKTTPTVVDAYDNVTSTAIVRVPRGCCSNLSIQNLTPDQAINVQNANETITNNI